MNDRFIRSQLEQLRSERNFLMPYIYLKAGLPRGTNLFIKIGIGTCYISNFPDGIND